MNQETEVRSDLRRIRAILAIYTTLQSFALLVFFAISPHLFRAIKRDEAQTIIELLLPLLCSQLGLIIGFYFGEKEHRE
jgi:hypothetical protein